MSLVLSGANSTSPRTQFVVNIEPDGTSDTVYTSGAVRFGRYKFLVNATGGDCDECPVGAGCDEPVYGIEPCAGSMGDDVPVLIDIEADPAENINLYLADGYEVRG